MIMKQIRLSQQAKDQLSRLKGKTGIKNWNILCRWALCYSLGENTMPTDIPVASDSNVEMSWYTFAGEYSELYEALIKANRKDLIGFSKKCLIRPRKNNQQHRYPPKYNKQKRG